MWRRSSSSAGSRPGWCRTTSRPGWTGRTCMTRRSTGPMPSWPRITAAWSTRPGAVKPRDKARVERPMPYVRDSFWRGREFTSLAQMQAEAERWSRGGRRAAGVPAAGRRRPGRGVRRGGEGRAAAAARRAVRAGHLGDGRRSARTSTPRSARSCTRCRGSTSARPPTCGSTAHDGAVLHRRGAGQDPPAQDRAASRPTSATTRRRRSRSTCAPRPGAAARPPTIGPACEQVIAELLADNALYRLRAAQGVIGLADKHDPSRLEAACAKAIAAGDPSYRTIKGILAAGTEARPARPPRRGRRRRRVPARPGRRSPTSSPCPATITSDCRPPAARRR